MGAILGVGQAFVPVGQTGAFGKHASLASPQVPQAAAAVAVGRSPNQQGHAASAASGVAAALIVAALWRAQRPTAAARKSPSVAAVALKPCADAAPAAFAGATLAPVTSEARPGQSLVARQSLKSCHKLYFKRTRPYKDRAKKNIRNRAYNIYQKNQYRRDMRTALKKVKDIQYAEKEPKSLDEVMTELKPYLDNACLTIDEVCIQGILHRNTAARRKDRILRAVLRASAAMGVAEKPEDPFVPAYEVLGYEMPKSLKTREPRPWQLPGWKSPWMLKKEFDKWRKQRAEKVAA